MFVVDAFLKNPDRNNGNWGVLMRAPMSYELAPVYDLGSSLFSKRSASIAEDREQDAFGTNVSCYRLALPDGGSEAIHPFSYMATTHNPDLAAAVERFANAVDLDVVDGIIDSIPGEAFGVVLMTDAVRRSHKELLRYRYEKGIAPLLGA